MTVDELTTSFEVGNIDTTTFDHADHVRVAFGMLKKYDFAKAAYLYADQIRQMAIRVGAPEKYNVTITFAFMGVIASRMKSGEAEGFDGFINANPDLLEKRILNKWYTYEELMTPLARQVFMLPQQAV